MSEARTWSLYGRGTIGKRLLEQVGKPELAERHSLKPEPEFIARTTGLYGPDGETLLTDDEAKVGPAEVTFVALPSNVGELAQEVILGGLASGGVVVTAEKGAMSQYYAELEEASDGFKRLGVRATVGGGTRIVDQLRGYTIDPKNINQLHLALNGTLTYIFSSVAAGASFGQAAESAVELGYAEPLAPGTMADPIEIVRGEAAGDIPKKVSILFNLLGLSDQKLSATEFDFDLDEESIRHALSEARVRRFIVSLRPAGRIVYSNLDTLAGFSVEHNGWEITGGFQHIERDPAFRSLGAMTDTDNGFVIGLGPNDQDGIYKLTGPGAGPRPTVTSMLDDLLALS